MQHSTKKKKGADVEPWKHHKSCLKHMYQLKFYMNNRIIWNSPTKNNKQTEYQIDKLAVFSFSLFPSVVLCYMYILLLAFYFSSFVFYAFRIWIYFELMPEFNFQMKCLTVNGFVYSWKMTLESWLRSSMTKFNWK